MDYNCQLRLSAAESARDADSAAPPAPQMGVNSTAGDYRVNVREICAEVRLGLGRVVASEIEAQISWQSGMKWMNGSAKRQCDRTLGLPDDRRARHAQVRLAGRGVLRLHRGPHRVCITPHQCCICTTSTASASRLLHARAPTHPNPPASPVPLGSKLAGARRRPTTWP